MPIYNAPLLQINAKETRRYAGLQKAENFSEERILNACEEAALLAVPRGIWEIYPYDCAAQTVLDESPFAIEGKSVGKHLAGCEKIILLAATVGEAVESQVTKLFEDGAYSASVLLDAAATAAVEQIADAMEKTIRQKMAREGYTMRWRFSPGYGDWPLEQQPELIRLSRAEEIDIHLSAALMLIPRKSITAAIGLARNTKTSEPSHTPKGCASCDKRDCPSRFIPDAGNQP